MQHNKEDLFELCLKGYISMKLLFTTLVKKEQSTTGKRVFELIIRIYRLHLSSDISSTLAEDVFKLLRF